MTKFLSAALVILFASAAADAAPKLGVTWRAAANAKVPGVKIMSIEDGSNAEELGLEVGDSVLAINDKIVKTGKEASDAVQAAKGKLKLLVMDSRGKGLVEIQADIDEPTQGFTAGPVGKGKYKNVKRVKK